MSGWYPRSVSLVVKVERVVGELVGRIELVAGNGVKRGEVLLRRCFLARHNIRR